MKSKVMRKKEAQDMQMECPLCWGAPEEGVTQERLLDLQRSGGGWGVWCSKRPS